MNDFDIYADDLGTPTPEQMELLQRNFELEQDAAEIYRRVFDTEAGRFVLDDLKKRFVMGARFNPALPDAECHKWGLVNEGKVMAVNYIIATAAFGKGAAGLPKSMTAEEIMAEATKGNNE